MPSPRIYLASGSPRRHELLLQMGVDHEVLLVPAPEGEDEPQLPGEAPELYVRRTARDKANRAVQWLEQRKPRSPASGNQTACRPVLAADTTVILNGNVLGKPADCDDAVRMLTQLSGQSHYVHTALAYIVAGVLREDVSVTHVRFKTLSAREIQWYCDSGEPMGKAGAYGIQGKAGMFVEQISGSYTGVMGLPLFETARLLGWPEVELGSNAYRTDTVG